MRVRSREPGEKSECRVAKVRVQEMYQQSRPRSLRTSAAIFCRRLPPSAELEFLLLGVKMLKGGGSKCHLSLLTSQHLLNSRLQVKGKKTLSQFKIISHPRVLPVKIWKQASASKAQLPSSRRKISESSSNLSRTRARRTKYRAVCLRCKPI
jgi:hypothetical protein